MVSDMGSLSTGELARLQVAARTAWDAANLAARTKPRLGTQEWYDWQELVDAAIAANDLYLKALMPDRVARSKTSGTPDDPPSADDSDFRWTDRLNRHSPR